MTIKIKSPRKTVGVNPEWIPGRTLEWQEDDEGKVFLLKEKSRNRIMKWLIDKAGKSQYFRIHLDRFGAKAWRLADGKRSIVEIASDMANEFGDELNDASGRVIRFFTLLGSSGFVVFKHPGEPEQENR